MNNREPSSAIKVDVTNPGQFFACCGLLELAHRLWPEAEGWFENSHFALSPSCDLRALFDALASAELKQLEPEDDMASPLWVGGDFELTLNWWNDGSTDGKALKVWAGSMRSVRIARAMRHAMENIQEIESAFDCGAPVFDPENPRRKVEPYYFDSRRGWNAQSLDIGFSPDSLSMTTAAYPAVEFLCLVGLQRFRPAPSDYPRMFIYYPWNQPLAVQIASAAACGMLPGSTNAGFRFENAFRTDQKKHKSFLPAIPIGVHL